MEEDDKENNFLNEIMGDFCARLKHELNPQTLSSIIEPCIYFFKDYLKIYIYIFCIIGCSITVLLLIILIIVIRIDLKLK